MAFRTFPCLFFLEEHAVLCSKNAAEFKSRDNSLIVAPENRLRELAALQQKQTSLSSNDQSNGSKVFVGEQKYLMEIFSSQLSLFRFSPPEPSVFTGCALS